MTRRWPIKGSAGRPGGWERRPFLGPAVQECQKQKVQQGEGGGNIHAIHGSCDQIDSCVLPLYTPSTIDYVDLILAKEWIANLPSVFMFICPNWSFE